MIHFHIFPCTIRVNESLAKTHETDKRCSSSSLACLLLITIHLCETNISFIGLNNHFDVVFVIFYNKIMQMYLKTWSDMFTRFEIVSIEKNYCSDRNFIVFFCFFTINDNDMLSYSLTTMMCFLTKEWYGVPAYTVNLFIKAYHKITYKEDLKIT